MRTSSHRGKAAIGIVVALAVCVGSAAAASASKDGKSKRPKTVQLQLLSFNDYHGHLEAPGGTDATLGATLDPSATLVGGGRLQLRLRLIHRLRSSRRLCGRFDVVVPAQHMCFS